MAFHIDDECLNAGNIKVSYSDAAGTVTGELDIFGPGLPATTIQLSSNGVSGTSSVEFATSSFSGNDLKYKFKLNDTNETIHRHEPNGTSYPPAPCPEPES